MQCEEPSKAGGAERNWAIQEVIPREGRLYAEMHTKTFTIFSHVLMSYDEKNKTLFSLIMVNDKFSSQFWELTNHHTIKCMQQTRRTDQRVVSMLRVLDTYCKYVVWRSKFHIFFLIFNWFWMQLNNRAIRHVITCAHWLNIGNGRMIDYTFE